MKVYLIELWASFLRYLSPDNYLHPQWLLGIGLVAILGMLLALTLAGRFKRRLRLFAAARLQVPVRQTAALTFKYVRLTLVMLAMAILFFGLARPMGYAQSQKASRQGSNFLIALDASNSMLAEDVKPNRFQLAQLGVTSLLNNFGSDRAAAMMFAGTPTLVAPLTFDTVSLELVMRDLTPELSGKVGSSLSAVITSAAEYLSRKDYPSKAIIVFSDGEETEGDGVIAAQRAYQQHGVRVFTIGVGTTAGSAIPKWERNLNRDLVRAGVVKDAEGQAVHSNLDEQTLQLVASVGGGRYVDLSASQGDLRNFYHQFLRPLAAPLEAVPLEDRQEWFKIPLFVGLVLLILELWVPQSLAPWIHRRKTSADSARAQVKRTTAAGRKATAAQFLLMALVSGVVWHSRPASAGPASPNPPSVDPLQSLLEDPALKPAKQLLSSGQFDKAFRVLQRMLLDHPHDPLAHYNYAIGAYAAGRYGVALETFQKLAEEPHAQVQALSCLQAGNTLYRIGDEMVRNNPEGAIVHWTKALEAYRPAVGQPIVNHNSRYVRDLLLSRLYLMGKIREKEGDESAMVALEQGTNAWQEAMGFYNQAMKVSVEEEQIRASTKVRAGLVGKIYRAYMDVADEKRKKAVAQKEGSLELAIEEMGEAVKFYTAALTIKENDPKATAGLQAAQTVFEPWQVEFAEEYTAKGEELRHTDVETAVNHWQQADALYTRVLEQNETSQGALKGQQTLHPKMASAYREIGDNIYHYSTEPIRTGKERMKLMEEALDAYQKAKHYAPENTTIDARVTKIGRLLAGRLIERGEEEYTEAQKSVLSQPPEAIAGLEKSLQSFNRALFFDKENVRGIAGRDKAEEQLRELRLADAEALRRKLAAQKKDPNKKDAGKKAKQLLKTNTEKLKKKELKPEDRSVKDW